MLDQWLEEEVNIHLDRKDRLVFLDPKGEYEFALHTIKDISDIALIEAEEPLKAKYLVEKNFPDQPCVIYVRKTKKDLEYLAEYAATGEVFDVTLTDFVREKAGLEEIQESVLAAAAKKSLGKSESFWQNVAAKGKEGIFENIDRQVLAFLSNPDEFKRKLNDEVIYDLFTEVIDDKYGVTEPSTRPENLASELAKAVLLSSLGGNVLTDQIDELPQTQKDSLTSLYKEWLNSKAEENSLKRYAEKVEKEINWEEILQTTNLWDLGSNHPFASIDKKLQDKNLSKGLQEDPRSTLLEKKSYIKNRAESQAAQTFEIKSWEVFSCLVDFFGHELKKRSLQGAHLDELFEIYDQSLWKLDTARRLACTYLSNGNLKSKLHKLYLREWEPIWETWVKASKEAFLTNDYQQVYLKDLFTKNSKTAILVADAFRYEMAKGLEKKFESFDFAITPRLAVLPTVTSTGMGGMFSSGNFSINTDLIVKDEDTNMKLKDRKSRLANLKELTGLNIKQAELTRTNYPDANQVDGLLIYLRDVDSLGETAGFSALQYFEKIIEKISRIIKILLQKDYEQIYLVSDHGFIVEDPKEAEKITTQNIKSFHHSDRYLISQKTIDIGGSMELTPDYFTKARLYFPHQRGVFKKPSTYQFMHGGISPQELIVPELKVTKTSKRLEEFPIKIAGDKPKQVNFRKFSITVKATKEKGMFEKPRGFVLSLAREGEETFQSNEVLVTPGGQAEAEIGLEEGTKPGKYNLYLLDAKTLKIEDKCVIDYRPLREDTGL